MGADRRQTKRRRGFRRRSHRAEGDLAVARGRETASVGLVRRLPDAAPVIRPRPADLIAVWARA